MAIILNDIEEGDRVLLRDTECASVGVVRVEAIAVSERMFWVVVDDYMVGLDTGKIKAHYYGGEWVRAEPLGLNEPLMPDRRASHPRHEVVGAVERARREYAKKVERERRREVEKVNKLRLGMKKLLKQEEARMDKIAREHSQQMNEVRIAVINAETFAERKADMEELAGMRLPNFHGQVRKADPLNDANRFQKRTEGNPVEGNAYTEEICVGPLCCAGTNMLTVVDLTPDDWYWDEPDTDTYTQFQVYAEASRAGRPYPRKRPRSEPLTEPLYIGHLR